MFPELSRVVDWVRGVAGVSFDEFSLLEFGDVPFDHMVVDGEGVCDFQEVFSWVVVEVAEDVSGVFVAQDGFCDRALFCFKSSFDEVVHLFSPYISASYQVGLLQFSEVPGCVAWFEVKFSCDFSEV